MLVKERYKFHDQLWMTEEFKVGFLINIAVLRSPTKLWIIRSDSIHLGLRVDSQQEVLVHLQKDV